MSGLCGRRQTLSTQHQGETSKDKSSINSYSQFDLTNATLYAHNKEQELFLGYQSILIPSTYGLFRYNHQLNRKPRYKNSSGSKNYTQFAKIDNETSQINRNLTRLNLSTRVDNKTTFKLGNLKNSSHSKVFNQYYLTNIQYYENRRRSDSPLKNCGRPLDSKINTKIRSIKNCIWPEIRLSNNLFCLTASSLLIDTFSRQRLLEIREAQGLIYGDGRFGVVNKRPKWFLTEYIESESEIDHEFESDISDEVQSDSSSLDADVKNDYDSLTHFEYQPRISRVRLEHQSRLSFIDKTSNTLSDLDRYGTTVEILEDIRKFLSANCLIELESNPKSKNQKEQGPNSELESTSLVHSVMSLSYSSPQLKENQGLNLSSTSSSSMIHAKTPVNYHTAGDSQIIPYVQYNAELKLSNIETETAAAATSTPRKLQSNINRSSLFPTTSSHHKLFTSSLNSTNNNNNKTCKDFQPDFQLNNNKFGEMVGTQQNPSHVQLSSGGTGAIGDASKYTGLGDLESVPIEMKINKAEASPALLTMAMPQASGQAQVSTDRGCGTGAENANNPTQHTCSAIPYFGSNYGTTSLFHDRKLTKPPPAMHGISNYTDSTIDGCGISSSVQGMHLQ